MNITEKISYCDFAKSKISDDLLKACGKLFSEHYAVRPNGDRVKMGPQTLKKLFLFNEKCRLVFAQDAEVIIGHAFYVLFESELGKSIWITQLIVDKEYRNRKIAKTLISIILSHGWEVVGLVSSHPYAIKSLERSTERFVDPEINQRYAEDIIRSSNVPYLKDAKIYDNVIDTNFDVDHKEINDILNQLNDWKLGTLPDKFEFIGLIIRIARF